MVKYLTPAEVAEILQLSKSTTYKLFNQKGFPSVKIGGNFRVAEDDLERFMKSYIGKEFTISD